MNQKQTTNSIHEAARRFWIYVEIAVATSIRSMSVICISLGGDIADFALRLIHSVHVYDSYASAVVMHVHVCTRTNPDHIMSC